MVFLLSSARSGSTLLRVMLAGHPALFCPPELALLGKRSMRERNQTLLHPARGHGLQRALMELKNITADAADALVAALVEQDADTQSVYRMLQELAGARLLLDKTPGYALSLATLERAEELFEAPRYIHLTRHPYAVIESIMRNRMDQLLGLPSADPFQVAEEVWTTANRNLLDFLRQVDPQRQHRVSYEELVAAPAAVMAELCAFLGVPLDDAVLDPYRGRRMSDGIGDPNFHEHSVIEPSLGQAWRQVRLPRALSEPTRDLALALNYELPQALATPTLPLSFAQERLWFLHQLDPSSPAYNLPKAIQIGGPLKSALLRRCLDELLRRHAILRTAFVEVAGLPAQLIAPALRISLPLIDLTALPPTERAATARRLLIENARLPFDLACAPLLRVLLLRLAADDHALLTTPHHIVFDRWSRGVLDREMAALYGAFSAGQPSPLPALPLQYADVARWQRGWLRGDVLQTQLAYWRAQLGGDLAVLALPTDRPRPPVETFRGAEHARVLPQRLGHALKALGQREGVTLFMTLLAAFQTLLARYSGQADIVVGSPVTQRSRAETELLIGPFINMLVLRGDLSGDPSFRGLLGRVRELTLGAYAHQDLPFEQLVRELQPTRDLSRQPLFQVTFILQNIPAVVIPYPGLTFSPLKVESGTALVDLTLIAVETAHGISATLNYNTDLFDQATIARMLTHLQTLLEGALTAPDHSVWALPLLTRAERQQLLLDWNDTGSGARSTVADSVCLHDLIEAQAARTPDAIAIVYDRGQGSGVRDQESPAFSLQRSAFSVRHLTYLELDRRANQLSQHLRGLGVGPETPVAVCVERSVELLIALLGVLKAGGAYLPLDPTYPRERLAAMLEDSQARVLITQTSIDASGRGTIYRALTQDEGGQGTMYRAPTQDEGGQGTMYRAPTQDQGTTTDHIIVNRKSKIVNLQTDWPTIAQTSAQPPATIVNRKSEIVNADNLAYIIYTSGSTGRPKGVMIAHQALVNLLGAMRERPGFGATDVLLAVTTLSFDIAALELFLPLIAGGRLVVASRETATDGRQLLAALARCRATMLQATPISWRILLEAGWTGAQPLKVLCGGEALPRELADALLERGAAVWNMYGPTETTVWSALQPITQPGRVPPIGRPIANTRMYILDRQLRPAPIGVVGELYIGGAGLARGYFAQPALTAERFVPNPFLSPPFLPAGGGAAGGVLYRTGDLARYWPDGTIECLGRRDQQVKVRGFRIELGDVEAALRAHPAVQASAVVLREDAPGAMRLVAYVVQGSGVRDQGSGSEDKETSRQGDKEEPNVTLSPGHLVTLSPAELRAFLTARLPNYMIPVVFVALDELPLTPNGKLNRRALPAPDAAAVLPSATYAPPRDPTQVALADIWAQVLDVRVGIHDNFFALGGHSLLATQVMSRVRATFKVELSVRTLFETTTVAALAERIDTIQWAVQDQPAADDAADDHEEIAF
jgi:amino acid adenylation domain-containing protein